jgi:hypothetical protein
MMKRLRGKNLAHPGCLVGVTTGLIIGIILAGILASVFNVAYTTVLLVWFGLTFGPGSYWLDHWQQFDQQVSRTCGRGTIDRD